MVRLVRKIVGVAGDKMIGTAVAPRRHSRAGGNPGGDWRTVTLDSRLRGNDECAGMTGAREWRLGGNDGWVANSSA